jgi:hypothetical protein
VKFNTYEYDELVRLKSIKEERNEQAYREVKYSFDDSGNRIQEITAYSVFRVRLNR